MSTGPTTRDPMTTGQSTKVQSLPIVDPILAPSTAPSTLQSATKRSTSTTLKTPQPSTDALPSSLPSSSYISPPTTFPTPDGVSSGGSLTPEGRIGLGLGLGIGIPLIALLGLGCFFLWRLWGRQEKTVQERNDGQDKKSTTEAGGAKELDSAQIYEADGKQRQKDPPPRELQSIEIYEAEGGDRGTWGPIMRPVELGT
ncbi:hypothetical protein PG995_007371 [Apiospora arundinis]